MYTDVLPFFEGKIRVFAIRNGEIDICQASFLAFPTLWKFVENNPEKKRKPTKAVKAKLSFIIKVGALSRDE